jgi:hypothetical protein
MSGENVTQALRNVAAAAVRKLAQQNDSEDCPCGPQVEPPVARRYADAQVAAERERIAATIAQAANEWKDLHGQETPWVEAYRLCADIARGQP